MRRTASDAWRMGHAAGSTGKLLDDNPFPKGQVMVSWMTGWTVGNNERSRREASNA
jgi:hypothetical protein